MSPMFPAHPPQAIVLPDERGRVRAAAVKKHHLFACPYVCGICCSRHFRPYIKIMDKYERLPLTFPGGNVLWGGVVGCRGISIGSRRNSSYS